MSNVHKPVLVHISNDYPDCMAPRKTKAVLNLVEGTPQYHHVVYSLNRVTALSGIADMEFGDERIAVAYGALPKGIFWEKRLPEVAQWIIGDMRKRGIKPDLILAHKITIEGVIGLEISKAFDAPLVCDIMGYTDINILRKKKSLRGCYQEIVRKSSAIFPYAPWSLDEFQKIIPVDGQKCTYLPVVPDVDKMMPAPIIDKDKLISVFHLDGWENKNFEGMVRAVKNLSARRPSIQLDVYGGGSPKTIMVLQGILNKHNAGEHVRLMGAVDNSDMQKIMQQYAGFVMPSKSESYGLVYVEALFSGVPVLFNAKRGIAGYYDSDRIGAGVDAHDIQSIERGMEHLLDHERTLKNGIAQMQKSGAFDQLRKGKILKKYSAVIDRVLSERAHEKVAA